MKETNADRTIWFPNKRVIRTVLQTIAGVVLALATGLGVFNLVAPQVLEAVQEVLPPAWYAWLVGFVAAVATIAGVLSKIMTIPQVDQFLKHFGAGSAPADVDVPTIVQVQEDAAVVRALTADVPTQVATLVEAADRLGLPAESITRDQFGDFLDGTGQGTEPPPAH